MKRLASEVLRDLEIRVARLEKQASLIVSPLSRQEQKEFKQLLSWGRDSLLPKEQSRLDYLLKRQGITPSQGKVQITRPLSRQEQKELNQLLSWGRE